MVRSTLVVSRDCANACRFCAQRGLELPVPENRSARLLELRTQADEITLIGGDPTELVDLVELVAEARTARFSAIGLQTHGAGIDPGRLDALVDAGLTDLHLSLHGPRREVHDYLVGRPGAFDQLVGVAAGARRRRLTVVVNTVVCRSNFRHLAPMPELLRRLGVQGWATSILRIAGGAEAHFPALVPRLGMALPHVVHAIDLARRQGLPAWIVGAPWCGLGPYAARSLPSPTRSYPSACEHCPARGRCPGVDARYVEAFGDGELRPRRLPPHADEPHPELARMFVGPGPLAPPRKTPPPDAASAGRRLPVLGQE